jgi:predicted metal-binding membrane protein
MSRKRTLDVLLSRDRWIVGGCLAMLCLIAWIWLARHAAGMSAASPGAAAGMAGMNMPGMIMPTLPAPAPAHLFADWLGAFVMWTVMMAAMMLPSAAPMILLYSAFARGVKAQGAVLAPTLAFAGVYLLLWAAFSAVAAAAQVLLAQAHWLSAETLRLNGGRIAGGLLALAGLYQLTPIKRACLEQCRSPLSFVTRLWRPGWMGALRLGLAHGAFCIGCCWMLMALLFVGGVMSLAWVAVLAVVVLIEKAAPIGERGARVVGYVALVAGAALILGASLDMPILAILGGRDGLLEFRGFGQARTIHEFLLKDGPQGA